MPCRGLLALVPLLLIASWAVADEKGIVPVPAAVQTLKRSLASLESRVVGRPDPPLPFGVVAVYPKLAMENPMFVMRQPGSSRLLFLDKGGKRLCRTGDDPATGKLDVLFTNPGIAYSLAVHPKFRENGRLYLGGDRSAKTPSGKECTVTELRLDPGKGFSVVKDSARIILSWDSNGHNGAAIGFGHDGMLYITSGDGTSDSDTNVTGQGMDHLLAKVLRIDIDHPPKGKTYAVPKDNPFVGRKGIRPETWAFGLRNPWRLSVDPLTGNIWVGNNGQDLWEQIYLVHRGDNFGWSVYEGSHPFYLQRKLGPAPHVKPTFEHPHSEARSMTGGVVYTGKEFPELHGAYIYGDYSTGKIWAGKMDGDKVAWHKEIADTALQIVGFGQDAAGNLLVVDYRKPAPFYALRRSPPSAKTATEFPRKLSQTGLFASVKGHRVHPAVIPYSVNAPLWSDGAVKHRYIAMTVTRDKQRKPVVGAISPGGDTRGWTFPDGTVLVKSFSLVLDVDGKPRDRWVETRLLYREQGEWVGYSYEWNREQTEATLVDAQGRDREFVVAGPKGSFMKLPYHFPARAECMVCHSRAAQYVLGLTTVQMNRDHVHGGVAVNQLSLLKNLGILPLDTRAELAARYQKKLKAKGLGEAAVKKTLADYQVQLEAGRVLSGTLASKPHLVSPYQEGPELELRVRSYLHANCAQCHVGAGGGNSQMDLDFAKPIAGGKVIDALPVHDKFKIPNARIVAPGDPGRSVLLKRIARRGRGQMPQLATVRLDHRAVDLVTRWIKALPAKPAAKAKSSGD
ncbi:MAG: PQQ-dependent sugar dehydrogenase [Planctomycetaceae bacterium]|jgi:glucose/arabinose dehydrogenase|nr:PQQ-dependent sugar dehydrogenase [Planctomycetaceae bacterium]